MKPFVFKFIVPLIIGGSLFGFLIVYRDGWDAASYRHYDPSSFFFVALGGVSAPLGIAFVVAGLVKLFARGISFLNVWRTVFLISVVVFGYATFTVVRYEQANAEPTKAAPLEECPISANFSNEATIKEIDESTKYRGKTWRVTEIYHDGFSSLDCYLVPPSEMLSTVSPVDILVAWAVQEGLEQEGIFAVQTPYPHSKMITRKFVDGRELVFDQRIFLFPDSFVFVTTASDRINFPSEDNKKFMASLKISQDYR